MLEFLGSTRGLQVVVSTTFSVLVEVFGHMATLAVTTGLEKRRRIINRRSNFFIFLPGAFFRVFFGVKLGGAKIYSCLFHLGICFGELPVLVESDAFKNSPTHPMVNHACLLGIPGNNDNPQASAASETPFFL